MQTPFLVLSQYYEEVVPAIYSSTSVADGFEILPGERISEDDPRLRQTKALWDTGAMMTCISRRLAIDMNLEPRSFEAIGTASGLEEEVPVYVAHLVFSAQAQFLNLEMTRFITAGDDDADLIIGMDIIGQGDFAITNSGGRTLFSFLLPSSHSIDFEAELLAADR